MGSKENKSPIYQCIENKINGNDSLSDEIYSLIVFGSFERGDFIEGLSDIDFFVAIEEDKSIINNLRDIIEECLENIDYRMIDLCWEYRDNLDDPMNKGVPYKFLTFYQFDFFNNHSVIYGDQIENKIPEYQKENLIEWRANKLLDSCNEHKDDFSMIKIISGEVARLIALLNGAESIKKSDTIKTLRESDEKNAKDIYEAYLKDEQDKLDKEYLIDFIKRKCNNIIEGELSDG